MESRILMFNGDEANYIDHEQLDLTVKLSPLSYGTTTYDDVFRALDQAGLNPDDIGGLYKVSSTDFSYSLYVSNEDVKKRLTDLKVIGSGKGQFGVVCLTEQTVKLKIHWLPLYYSNRLLKAIFCDYGDVLDVSMCKSSYAHVCALNGMREVLLKTDEIHKQRIPHLVKLSSGQSILITMQGRPPLCLKCNEIGHTRKDCPNARRSYVNTARASGSTRSPDPQQTQFAESVSARGSPDVPPPAAPPTVVDSAPARAPNGAPAGAVAAAPTPDLGSAGSNGPGDVSVTQEVEGMDAESARLKRARESDEDFITPNRPVRPTPPSPGLHLPLSEGFKSLLGDTPM